MNPTLQLPRIHLDHGAVSVLPSELKRLGVSRPLFVTDANLVSLGVFDQACSAMPERHATFSDVPQNPTVAAAEQCAAVYAQRHCDGIVAVGGGSVIDCAKAAALLATHEGPLTPFLGRPDRLERAPAPLIAVPTTAGTGSEVSRGCGIHPDERSRGLGINHPMMVPQTAICDPTLTVNLSPGLTAGTGLDALSHCIEGFLAKSDNPLVDAIALDGVKRVFAYVERAAGDGGDRGARYHMMAAGAQGGISIWKGLGPAHAIANTCGDRGLHHGWMTAIAMPFVLRFYEAKGMQKLGALAEAMGCAPNGSPADALAKLNGRLGAPPTIRALGYGEADLDDVVQDATGSFFNRPSPYALSSDDYRAILQQLL